MSADNKSQGGAPPFIGVAEAGGPARADVRASTIALVQFNQMFVGAILVRLAKSVSKGDPKSLPMALMHVAAVCLLVSLTLDSYQPAVDGGNFASGVSVTDTVSSFVEALGTACIVVIAHRRARVIAPVRPRSRAVAAALTATMLVTMAATRIVNVVMLAEDGDAQARYTIAIARQYLRTVYNIVAAAFFMFMETYVTHVIFQVRAAGSLPRNRGGNGAAAKRTTMGGGPDDAIRSMNLSNKRLRIFYSAVITSVFLIQAALQLARTWGGVVWAPLHGLGLAIVLTRMFEFKDEYVAAQQAADRNTVIVANHHMLAGGGSSSAGSMASAPMAGGGSFSTAATLTPGAGASPLPHHHQQQQQFGFPASSAGFSGTTAATAARSRAELGSVPMRAYRPAAP